MYDDSVLSCWRHVYSSVCIPIASSVADDMYEVCIPIASSVADDMYILVVFL